MAHAKQKYQAGKIYTNAIIGEYYVYVTDVQIHYSSLLGVKDIVYSYYYLDDPDQEYDIYQHEMSEQWIEANEDRIG